MKVNGHLTLLKLFPHPFVRFHAINRTNIAFVVLLGLLFSGVTGLTLFGLGVMWLILNAAAIFFCMFIKIKLNHNLEKCMAQVNKHLLRHKILLGLDDRGKISCHKVNLCFIYFDTTDCVVSENFLLGYNSISFF